MFSSFCIAVEKNAQRRGTNNQNMRNSVCFVVLSLLKNIQDTKLNSKGDRTGTCFNPVKNKQYPGVHHRGCCCRSLISYGSTLKPLTSPFILFSGIDHSGAAGL